MCGSLFLGLLAVLFPPLPVWIKRGICSADGLINIALCCLGFIPGMIHAWYIIAKYPEETYGQYQPIDSEAAAAANNGGNQRVYVYTATYPSSASHSQPRYAPQNQSSKKALNAAKTGPQHYGTTSSSVPLAAGGGGGGGDHANAANGPQFLPNETSSGAEASSSQQQQPPSYNDAVKGDFKVQTSD